MPTGWSYFIAPGTRGNNLSITNGQLQIGQVDTAGGIYRSFNTSGVTRVQIDYDAGIPNMAFGGGVASILTSNILNYNFGPGRVQAGAGKTSGGGSMSSIVDYVSPGGVFQNAFTGALGNQSGSSNFHFSTTYQDGLVSQTLKNLVSGQTFSSGNVAISGFKLSDMSQLALFGVTTTGASGSFDNVTITQTKDSPAPTCTLPQVLQNGSCVTPPPVCTPPQVLQNGVCVAVAPPPPPSVPPSVYTMARMSDAVYNRLALTQNPDIGTYQAVDCLTRDGYLQSGNCLGQTADGFKATVYKDSSSNQVVVAIRGTDNYDPTYKPLVKNLLADASLWGDGSADALVGSYTTSLAKVLHDVQQAFPDSPISLTGHSLGGALAQVVGDKARVRTITFDAPGMKDVLNADQYRQMEIALGSSAYKSASDVVEIVNYRMQEDQVSMIGKGGLIDKKRQFGEVFTVWNPYAGVNRTGPDLLDNLDLLQNHSMANLVGLLRDNCAPAIPSGEQCIVSGYGSDQNAVLRTIAAAANISCGILPDWMANKIAGVAQLNKICEAVSVSSRVVDLLNIDPAPGNRYLVGIGSGSPQLAKFVLPRFIGVGGWALRSLDEGVWSDYEFQTGDGQFLFANGVDGVEFFTTDQSGNPMFNPYWFDYQAQFAADGGVNLFQVSINDVDEPGTVLLLGASLLALLVSQRKRAKVFSYLLFGEDTQQKNAHGIGKEHAHATLKLTAIAPVAA